MDTTVTLDRILVINDQLAKLDEMGIPISLGFEPGPHRVAGTQAQRLREVSAQLALHPGTAGDASAVLKDDSLPPLYRATLATWLHCDSPATVLDSLVQHGCPAREIGKDLRRSFVQPLIVLALSFVGFCFLCVYLYPELNRVYENAFMQPGATLARLTEIGEAMPTWIWLAPVVLLTLLAFGWHMTSKIRLSLLPVGSPFQRLLDSARCSGLAACLLESGNSVEQADALVARANKSADMPSPILRWAFSQTEATGDAAPTMRGLERFYYSLANRQSILWRHLIPLFVGVFLGGVIVLIYSLCLFLPLVELLTDITSPEIHSPNIVDRGGL